ncbi:hypothetical protein LOTGIDRAFT_103360, partial [Lottia gigantea]
MKHSKSDHSGIGQGSGKSRLLGKTYLSKSHENLSSHQKKKLSTVMEQPSVSKSKGTTKLSDSSKSVDKNKENVALKEKEKGSGRSKPNKPATLPTPGQIPLRKASSTQSIDKTSLGGSSTISCPTKTQPMNTSNKTLSIKRAQSTQNVSKDKLTRKRTSAPADVMAYNAELLANFEKEKKLQEARISELIQKAEGRKAEIERLKYENKRLKEQIPSVAVKDELELLRNQNKNLSDRLTELGIPIEQITDAE